MKKYTEEDLRKAYKAGRLKGSTENNGYYSDIHLDEDEYIESLKEVVIEESKEIPITYGLIKAKCGWSEFAEKTNRNVYAVKEFGDYPLNEVFYITESQAKELKFI